MDLKQRDIRVTNKVYDTLAEYFGKDVVISDLNRTQLHEFIQNVWVKEKTYAVVDKLYNEAYGNIPSIANHLFDFAKPLYASRVEKIFNKIIWNIAVGQD